MLRIKDAKPIFALTVVLAPWDLLLFVRGGGWGLTFVFGRFVVIPRGIQFLDPASLAGAYLGLGDTGMVGLVVTLVWVACGLVTAGAAMSTVHGRLADGRTSIARDRRVGAVFVVAGSVFLLSRVLVSLAELFWWRSVPLGALYVIFVGTLFYYGKF